MDYLIWNKIAENLTRDDIASALRADVNCCIDCMYPEILKKIPKDGFNINICIKCVKYILCDRLQMHRLKDSRNMFECAANEIIKNEHGTYGESYKWFVYDMMTIFTRFAIIDEKIKYTEDCIFCNKRDVVLSTLKSSVFKKQFKKYIKLISKYVKMIDNNNDIPYDDIFYFEHQYPLYYQDDDEIVCKRCGFLDCNGKENCVWFFGEGKKEKHISTRKCEDCEYSSIIYVKVSIDKQKCLFHKDYSLVSCGNCECYCNNPECKVHLKPKVKFVNIW